MGSYLHQQRVAESQSALQVLPEGIVQKAGAGDLLVFKLVHDELRGLTRRVNDQRIPAEHRTRVRISESYCAFTPDATCANKSRCSRVVGHLNILNLLASFAREIHFTTDVSSRHGGASVTVNSADNGGALNTTSILVLLIYFVINKQTIIRAAG